MRITESGTISRHDANDRAVRSFPAVLRLTDGRLLATCRAGSSKDSDDGIVELYTSTDTGRTWSDAQVLFSDLRVDGRRGSLHLCYLTELKPGRLLAATLWIDRDAQPGKPLFNPDTEGCLPMAIVLSDSSDGGRSWSSIRAVAMPEEIGPPSLTNPIIRLADGSLVMSIETNKNYEDSSKWYQRVVFFHSHDEGRTWGDMHVVGSDSSGRIFNWDQRLGLGMDGTLAAYVWTYDSEVRKYLSIRRRISTDNGRTWSTAEELGFSDQAGPPAVLSDGQVVLPWVDRFGTHSIRARLGSSLDAAFDPSSELEVYAHRLPARTAKEETTGDMLQHQGFWSYGLPFAVPLSGDAALVLYYAGDNSRMDIHYARIALGETG